MKKQAQRTFLACCLALMCLLPTLLAGCQNAGALVRAGVGNVVINEVVSSNTHSLVDPLLGSPDWIELYNSSDAPVSLAGCFMSDNLKDPKKWEFPAVTLAPGAYLLVYAASLGGDLPANTLCTGFGLSKSGERLYLFDPYINIIDEVQLPALVTDVSYARKPEGGFGFCASPTPGKPNTGDIVPTIEEITYAQDGDALMLTEVLPQNVSGLLAADGKRYPWAELTNASGGVLRLSDYYISDTPYAFEKARLPDRLLQPGERAVIFFSGERDTSDGQLHIPFKLGSADDGLYLSTGAGQTVGELRWETPAFADIAVVQAENENKYTAFPTPGEENDARRFSSMQASPMDAGDPVVINEVLPKNKYSALDQYGERPEWVELYNRSTEEVSLAGYYLSDKEDNLLKWAFPADAALAPGAYLLVFLSGKAQTGAELHASFGLSSSDAGLFLTNADGLRVDTVLLDADIPSNVSVGRSEEGALLYYYTPTPWAANDTGGVETVSAVPARNPDGVFISEVSAVSPAKSGQRDWIEFYNPTKKDIDLAGWTISNDIDAIGAYTIQSLRVPAGGYSVLYASSRSALQKENTATFGIAGSGARLFLFDEAGVLRERYETGVLYAHLTSGRDVSDAQSPRYFYTSATPGEKNSTSAYGGYVSAPVFARTALYQNAPFSLEISCATPGARIYYTTDGSKPTAASALYSGPISIQNNTPVRAVAMLDGLLASEITTRTYLFETPHTLPVICLNGDQSNIDAVYAATEKANRVEKEAHFAFYRADGALGVALPCGLRANGASTLTAAQKSFGVFFRGGYGQSEVRYPFFDGYSIDTFASLTLRNSGQDRARARLRDSYYSLAAEGLFIDNVATRPVIVYINGRYWGLYDLNENQNEDFLNSHYGVDPDQVDIIRRNVSALAGKNTDFKRVRAFGLGRDLGNEQNYAQYCEWVDMDYIIDYLITQTYFANSDIFNQKYWRSQDYAVKWRPVLFDMDFGFSGSNPSRNILSQYFRYDGVPSQDGSITNMDIFCGLKANSAWCERFVARYVYVVETHYTAERLTALLDEVAAALRPEMERHIKRWGAPSSLAAWEGHVKELRSCLEKRPAYALRFLQSYFGVSDAAMQAYKDAAKQ